MSSHLTQIYRFRIGTSPDEPLGTELPTLTDNALETLAEIIDDEDPVVLQDLVDTFLAEALRQTQRMQRALRDDDLAKLFLPAHSLKSSSATFGALRLARLSEMLEASLAEKRDKQILHKLVEAIAAEYKRVSTAMRYALAGWRTK